MNKLLIISRLLVVIPSLGYAIIYFTLIPIFALIYYKLPNEFYHSTIRYEQPLHYDANIILKELQNEYIKRLNNIYNSNEIIHDGWKIDINNISLNSLIIENGNVIIRLMLIMENFENDELKGVIRTNPKITYSLNVRHSIYYKYSGWIENRFIQIEDFYSSPFNHNKELEKAFKRKLFPYDYTNVSPDIFILPIKRSLDSKIIDFANATIGFPSKQSGHFYRMLYLSAVTITTLGYGDIVPITNLARMLIAVESVLGIILIGLFLNAISYESRN
jgi:hypothetical protein